MQTHPTKASGNGRKETQDMEQSTPFKPTKLGDDAQKRSIALLKAIAKIQTDDADSDLDFVATRVAAVVPGGIRALYKGRVSDEILKQLEG